MNQNKNQKILHYLHVRTGLLGHEIGKIVCWVDKQSRDKPAVSAPNTRSHMNYIHSASKLRTNFEAVQLEIITIDFDEI